jgi:hypothetical protein
VAAVVAAVAAGNPAALARPGKVVRVEEPRRAGTARYCVAHVPHGGEPYVTCIGPSVDPGDAIVLFDDHGHAATLRVIAAHPLHVCAVPTGAANTAWTVEATVLGHAVRGDYNGLIDGGLDPARSRLVAARKSVSGRPAPALGFDRVGDGVVDLVFESYLCDDAAAVTTTGPNACFELWTRVGDGWRLLRRDLSRSC